MAPPNVKKEVLAALPGYATDVAKKAGITESTVRRWLRNSETIECHVQRWRTTKHGHVQYWVSGPGVSAPQPKAKDAKIYARRWRKKRRLARAADDAIRNESLQIAARTIIEGDPFRNLFFGRGV